MVEKSVLMPLFNVECIENEIIDSESHRSLFRFSPLRRGLGITIGNALRRTLLSELEGVAIQAVRIANVSHEFATLPNVKEDILEILLNLKKIIFKGEITTPVVARLSSRGVGSICASDFNLPVDLKIINPKQHIATLTSSESLIDLEVSITNGRGYLLSEENVTNLPLGFLPVDSVFMPVTKVTYKVEEIYSSTSEAFQDSVSMDISTDCSLSPTTALSSATHILCELFQNMLAIKPASPDVAIKEERRIQPILIEELQLSARAYNCLKRSQINSIEDLLNYTKDDLLEIRNFGRKSADEVCNAVEEKLGVSLDNSKSNSIKDV
jgi:DNA-directed RNA polymerase subunit alpha